MTSTYTVSESLKVIEIDPSSDDRWESFVVSHPDALIYHHPAWISALSQEYGQQGVYLACEGTDGRLRAVMPLFYTRGLPFGGGLTGARLSSLPRTPLAGPLSKDIDATVAILQAAVARVSLSKKKVELQIKTQGLELEGLVREIECTPWRLSYVLTRPLAFSSEEPFRVPDNQERAKIRWAVNKAKRLGVRLRPADTKEELHDWYVLYLETMRRNAVPPRSYRFFSTLWDSLRPKGMMEVMLADCEESGCRRVLAGSIFLKFGGTVSYSFNGSSRQDLKLRMNDLIQWEAINGAFRDGFRYFDFGEVPDGHEKLAKFKTKWGAEPVRLYRYYYPARPKTEIKTSGNVSNHAVSLAEAIWTRLPLKMTAWLGDRLYSYL